MFWLIPTLLLSSIVTFLLGYYLRGLKKQVEELAEVVKSKVDKKVEETPRSTIIDPSDEVAEAIYAHEQMMKKLNGGRL